MKKIDLDKAVEKNMATTKEALQTLFDNVNKGQQKKTYKK